MPKQKYSPEFKSKVVLAILQGDKEFNVICAEHNLNPNMVHTWKREFLQNAPLAFSAHHERKEAKRKEDGLRKKNDQMLKTYRSAYTGTRFSSGLLSPSWGIHPGNAGL